MIELYVSLVKRQKRTCDVNNKEVRQVPNHLRADVLAALKAEGYDGDGNKMAK